MSDRALLWVQAVAAVLAAGAAAAALLMSIDSQRVAQESLAVARAQAAVLDRQAMEAYAAKVYVGEAPQEVSEELRVPPGELLYLVYNTSGIQVENVWVEGDDDRFVRIYGVQRCTMYELPLGFRPQHLHFTDPFGQWHRGPGHQLDSAFEPVRDGETSDVSRWWDTIDNCAG